MDDLQRILQNLGEIEALLRKHDYPGANPSALSRIEFLVSQMRGADTYISEKAGQIAALAGMYYSARRHMKYPGGADRLHTDMLYDLPSRIRGQASHLERLRARSE